MKNRSVLLAVLILAGAYSQPVLADSDDGVSNGWIPRWISRLELRPIVAGVMSGVSVNNIPDSIRQTTSYLGYPATLSANTKGLVVVYSFGLGFSLSGLNWLEFTMDFDYVNSYTGGQTTWNQIGYPSDDFVGYVFHGFSLDPGIKIILSTMHDSEGVEFLQVYAKTGIKRHWFTLSSGTDAYNQFAAQNNMSIDGYSYTVGAGIAFYMYGMEYQHSVSFVGYPKIRTDSFIFMLDLNFFVFNQKWCFSAFGCVW